MKKGLGMEEDGLDFLLKDLEEIKDIIREMEFDATDEEDEREGMEEREEEEYSESFENELKEYQEKFREYTKSIKRELRNFYKQEVKDAKRIETTYAERAERMREKEGIKTPWERGHKLGCGCPGCVKYRKFYGIEIERIQDPHSSISETLNIASTRKEREKVRYTENQRRPCGGRFYLFFHGKRAEFKRLFGKYSEGLNLNLAGY